MTEIVELLLILLPKMVEVESLTILLLLIQEVMVEEESPCHLLKDLPSEVDGVHHEKLLVIAAAEIMVEPVEDGV